MSTASNTNNLYDLYIQDVLNLAQTVVVKLDQVAQAVNYLVMSKTSSLEIDTADRTTWKYYQNISGAYHFTDETMEVESLDTGEMIVFNQANLASHPVTREAYTFGSYFYNELLARFPEQETLILGILYPCDIQTAIDAKDGTILAYPAGLVEETETEFLAQLQTWIYNHLKHWVTQAYAVSNNLYVATYRIQLALNLVPAIINLRLAACKTNQAHSFHIHSYLRDHGFTDYYLSILNRKQKLDFYRNIRYYQRRAGFNETFETLVDRLFTERNLPVYAYDHHHNVSAISYTEPGVFTNLYAESLFTREPVNETGKALPQTYLNLQDATNMLNAEATGNKAYHANNQEALRDVFARSPRSFYQTKVLESTLDSTGETYIQAPDQIVLNEWLKLTSKNVYRRSIEYSPPGAAVPLILTQQQAVALWVYAISRVLQPANPPEGYELLSRVPQIGVSNVLKDTPPSMADLKKLVDPGLLTDEEIQAYLDLVTPVPTLINSTTAFEQYCSKVYSNGYDMYRLYSYKQHPLGRAMGQMVSESLYWNKLIELPGLTVSNSPYLGMKYEDLFYDIGFAASNYDRIDYYAIVTGLFNKATGINLSLTSDPANIQEAMVALMRMLSSYSIAIVYNAAAEHAIASNHPDVRVAGWPLLESYELNVQAANVVTDLSAEMDDNTISINLNKLYPPKKPDMRETLSAAIPLGGTDIQDVQIQSSNPGRVVVSTYVSTSFDYDALVASLNTEQLNKVLSLDI